MFGIRQKLILGFGGLLAILLVMSGLGIAVLAKHRGALDQFLLENWRSVQYGQNIVEAANALKEIARPLNGEAAEPSPAQLAAAADAARPELDKIETNVTAEDRNITLVAEGEGKIADQLTSSWRGTNLKGETTSPQNFKAAFATLLNPQTTGTARQAAYTTAMARANALSQNANAIIQLNIENMNPVDHRAKQLADNATRVMIILAAAGALLAVGYTLLVSRSMLRPLQTVTKSIREIEQGNLDLVVQVKSRDELHQLAEAFNSMAAKLREFRRTDRAKLIRTQRTTQLAVNSLPDAIAIVTPDGMIDLCNETAQRVFGGMPGLRLEALRLQQVEALFEEVVVSLLPSKPRGYESAIEVYDQGGQLKFFLPRAVPICDAEKHLLGVTLVLSDVTNLRKLDELKSSMLSVVSHELKTPLTSIRMAVHLLLEERIGSLTPKQTELLVAAREDSDRLERIILDLLDAGRLNLGSAAMDLHAEAPEKFVSKAVGPFESAYHDRGVTLEVDVPLDLPKVMVDAPRMDRVFSNLLTNALKFTNPGGRVRVSTAVEEEFIRFRVEDTGVGIPAEYLPRVFDRFFRIPNNSDPSGAGLGLAIAREIVEAHGGTISVTSREGHGSCFSFTLRRADVSAEPSPEMTTKDSNEATVDSHNG